MGWALDVIVEIKHASSKGHRYILVDTDYFSKWVEAASLAKVDQEEVMAFIQNQIIYRFGTPDTITTYQPIVFVGRKVNEFAAEMRVQAININTILCPGKWESRSSE